ncbi:MAG: hypothetical protein CMO55_02015 [Verrucomicrobiales bacterium]|nr:hypothetical protein [Verrucomicrobiales bacterium]
MTDPSCISKEDRESGALWGSMIGDAICLAPHWMYDPEEIESQFGRLTDYADPAPNKYHRGKKAGDFTHYGDQTLTLMQSIAAASGYSPTFFRSLWKEMWPIYDGYVDSATKSTLRDGRGTSHDLAGASRIAPILVRSRELETDELLQAVRDQTSFTHGHPSVIDAAVYFALAFRNVLDGKPLEDAITEAADASYQSLDIPSILEEAKGDQDLENREALKKRGIACDVQQAFPSTMYLLLKYSDNFEAAVEENAMAGGDSAARGMLLGMLLGAYHGIGAIPERLVRGLSAYRSIDQWLRNVGEEE